MEDVVEGEAHYLEHLVHGGRHRGGNHPAMKTFIHEHGIMNDNASTSQTLTEYYGRVWQKDARAFIKTLGEMVTNPELHEPAVEAERSIIRSEILRNQDRSRSIELYQKTIYPSRLDFIHHPAGTVESINCITANGLNNFHKRNYTKHRAALIIKGIIDLNAVSEWIIPFIERLPDGNPSDRVRKIQYEPERFGFRHVKDKRTQSIDLEFLNLGPASGLELLLLGMARYFLTSSEMGSVYEALRIKCGFAYQIRNVIKGWPLHASGIGTDGIDEESVDTVIEVFNSTMKNANLDTFNEELVIKYKRGFIMQHTNTFEEPVDIDTIIRFWLEDMLFSYDAKAIFSEIMKVTPQDLLEIHRKYWNPDRMLIIRTDPT